MKSYKYILLSVVVICATATIEAQTPHSGYFLENMLTRHKLNPAIANDCNYINLPVVPGFSGVSVGMNGNVGIDRFLFKRNGELVTGLNSSVSDEEFLSGIKNNNYIEANISYDIFSMGFKKWGGYNTVDLTFKSNTGIGLPYALFDFAKCGQINGEETKYDIGESKLYSNNYAEFALGHSRILSKKLTVGVKLKYIAGLAHANLTVENINVSMGAEKWSVRESGNMFTTDIADITYKDNGEIDDIDFGRVGISGNGLGVDLGIVYNPINNLTLSAAVTDIGFINWRGDKAQLINKSFDYDGFHHLVAEDDPDTGESALNRESDQLEDDLRELIRFERQNSTSVTQSLSTTINIAAEYSILRNKISFGLLSSNRVGGYKSWSEVMLTANFRPVGWFNASVNGSVSNLGNSFGALLNFNAKSVSFYLGSDYIPSKFSKQGVPISSSKLNMVMGMAFKFGYSK